MHYEHMYGHIETQLRANSWEVTEDYQHEKDKEMILYLLDYPLPKWVIPKHEAEASFLRLIERQKWRHLGIKIYAPPPPPPMMPPPPGYNHPSMHQHRPMAPPPLQQQPPLAPPAHGNRLYPNGPPPHQQQYPQQIRPPAPPTNHVHPNPSHVANVQQNGGMQLPPNGHFPPPAGHMLRSQPFAQAHPLPGQPMLASHLQNQVPNMAGPSYAPYGTNVPPQNMHVAHAHMPAMYPPSGFPKPASKSSPKSGANPAQPAK